MAIITKIREQSGVAVGVVAIAMIAFVMAGLFTGNAQLFNSSPTVGEIDGHEITQQEFNRRMNRLSQLFTQAYGRQPQDAEIERFRQQIWQELLVEYAYEPELDKVGVEVTAEEIEDMMSGNNISPSVSAYFKNKQGQLDRTLLKNFLDNYETNPRMNALYQWISYPLKKERKLEKYAGLLTNTTYATKAEAKYDYQLQNTTVDLDNLYIPYRSVPDSAVSVSDSELEEYYSNNEKKYDRPANRELRYITFPLEATEQDEAEVKEALEAEVEAFAQTNDDTAFVNIKSDNPDSEESFKTMTLGEVPSALDLGSNPSEGDVFGPVKEDKTFKLYKVLGFQEDSVYWMRASHILIKPEDGDKAAARKEATRILREIKGGADFAAMARQYGTDGTRTRGGDLGWFSEGRMVEPFSKAVLNARTEGLLPNLVETQFGYHIIEVTGTKTKQRIELAIIEQNITPSQETVNEAYREVGRYRQATTFEELEALAEEDGKLLLQANTVRPDASSINNLSGPNVRRIVRWAYNDEREVGDISEEFDLEDQYVITVLTGKREEGIAPLEAVKNEVRTEVLEEKKKEVILNKLDGISGGSLNEMAQSYGKGANVNSAEDVSLSTFSISRAGFAPKTLGHVTKMKPSETSEPIADENGVMIVYLKEKNDPVEDVELASYKDRVEQRRSGTVYFDLQQAMEDFKDIEDERYKYY